MTAPDPAVVAVATELIRSELSDCEDCGCRQMAANLGALLAQEVRPLIAKQERQRLEDVRLGFIEMGRRDERERIRGGSRLCNNGTEYSVPADLLDGDGE